MFGLLLPTLFFTYLSPHNRSQLQLYLVARVEHHIVRRVTIICDGMRDTEWRHSVAETEKWINLGDGIWWRYVAGCLTFCWTMVIDVCCYFYFCTPHICMLNDSDSEVTIAHLRRYLCHVSGSFYGNKHWIWDWIKHQTMARLPWKWARTKSRVTYQDRCWSMAFNFFLASAFY